MSDAPSYAKPVGIGEVMEGGTVSDVVTSNVPGFAKGDIVVGRTGWQTHALSDGSGLQKVDPTRAPISAALSVLGMPGMTAYVGLFEIGKPAAGETVVVAAASGAVGSVVGQIARIKGARAVGIAGGTEKCRYVTKELGFDDCVDHRTPDFAARLAAACPKGVDVYFENVGGAVFEAVFPMLNPFARIPVCGLISMYNATTLSPSLMSGRGAIVGSAHAHALLAPPEGRSGSDCPIFVLSLTSPTHGCFNSLQGISHTGIQFHQQRQKLVRQVPRRLVVGSQFLLKRFWQVPRCLPAAGRMRLRRAMCWHGRKPYVGPVVSQSGNRHVVP